MDNKTITVTSPLLPDLGEFNEMLKEVFGRVDVTLPDDAFVQHYMHHVAMPKAWRESFRKVL